MLGQDLHCVFVGCNRKFKEQGSGHVHCHSHSPCADKSAARYAGENCPYCKALYNGAIDKSHPEAARTYALRLRKWVRGFGKNASDKGARGDWSVFSNQAEREKLVPLFTWALKSKHINLIQDLEAPAIPSSSSLPLPSSQAISLSSSFDEALGNGRGSDTSLISDSSPSCGARIEQRVSAPGDNVLASVVLEGR